MAVFRRRSPIEKPPKDRPFGTRVAGLWVRSLGEQRIANFLSRRGVDFDYEPNIADLRPDFVLPAHRIIIEYWGGAGFQKYEDHMVEKIDRYEREGYRVISIFPVQLGDLERQLRDGLVEAGVL